MNDSGMLTERAQVVAVEGDKVLLQTRRQSSCGSCSVKSGCGTSVLAGVVGQKVTQLTLPNTLGAKPGDEVLLGMAQNALVTGSLLMYLVPLIMLLLGALAGEGLAVWLGLDAELMPVVGAATGFVLAVAGVRAWLQGASARLQLKPVLLRILDKK